MRTRLDDHRDKSLLVGAQYYVSVVNGCSRLPRVVKKADTTPGSDRRDRKLQRATLVDARFREAVTAEIQIDEET
jgi:predicted nucleic acid-binding Zn ribbon protein